VSCKRDPLEAVAGELLDEALPKWSVERTE
jgi:hypothetical protein